MDLDAFRPTFEREQRIDIDFPDMTKEVLSYLVRFTRPAPGMNFITHSQLDETNADQVIREQAAYFTSIARPLGWKVYDYDRPQDLKQRLEAHGFVADELEAVMVLDLAESPAVLSQHDLQGVRLITTREQLVDVVRVLEGVWGGSYEWVYERLGPHLNIPGYVRVYVAELEGEAASCGWVYFNPGDQIATLWGGSTLEDARNAGLYTAVLAARTQEAIQRGKRYLCVDASPMSQRILEKYGFQVFTYAQDYTLKPQDVEGTP